MPFIILDDLTLVFPQSEPRVFPASVMAGIRFGGLGAYVYVLLHLGQRYFQRDVTTGGAMWCAVNLVLGPLLAATLGELWPTGADGDSPQFGQACVFFLAGLAPRFITDRISDYARSLLNRKGSSEGTLTRYLPLVQLRGINGAIEDRLYEEGIFDVYGLATVNPFRLLRRTPFDKRQIASWIDEALLVTFVPQGWQLLEQVGITGAIDLATYADDEEDSTATQEDDPPPDKPLEAPALPKAAKPQSSNSLIDLAKVVKMEPILFSDLIERIAQDAQVQLVWGLYQFVTSDDEESSNDV